MGARGSPSAGHQASILHNAGTAGVLKLLAADLLPAVSRGVRHA